MDVTFLTNRLPQGIDIQLYPAVRLVVVFIIGISIGYSCYTLIPSFVWSGLLLVSLLSCWILRNKKLGQSISVFMLLMTLGAWLTYFSYQKLEKPLPKGKRFYNAVLLTEPVKHNKVMQADLLLFHENTTLKAKTSILIDTVSGHYSSLHLADGILLYGELQSPTNFANATFDYAKYLKLHGYSAEIFLFDSQWQKANISLSSMSYVDRALLYAKVLRQHCVRLLQKSLQEDQLAIVSAMMLGDKSYVSKSLQNDYSITGASHVLALSGLHLSIIYAILWLLFSYFRKVLPFLRIEEIQHLLLQLTIWAYVFLVGFSPSVVRSALMLSIYSVVTLLGRKKMSLNTLAVVAFCILLYDPLTLFDISFQLSFSAVASILLTYSMFNKWLTRGIFLKHKWLSWFTQMIAMTLSAQVGTAPLVIFYFSKFPTYFFLSNFVAIPCTTIILYAGVAFFLFMAIAPLQWLATKVLFLTTTVLNTSLHWLASLPMASIDIGPLTVLQTILIYFMLFILLIVMTFFGERIKFR